LFDFLSLFGKGARSKKISPICFNFCNEFISGLLCGYFTGDGTIDGNISATTTSKKLADGVSLLLLKLKIGNYIKRRDGDAYKIMIPSYFTQIFAKKIGFRGRINQKKLENNLKGEFVIVL
jgi:intein/homing endonuclease